MVDVTTNYKIGAADRGLKLLQAETCQQLADQGFEAVELYIAGTTAGVSDNEADHRRNFKVVAKSGLSLAIHIVGDDVLPPFNGLRRALDWLSSEDEEVLPRQTPLVVHPSQGPRDQRGANRPRHIPEGATKLLTEMIARANDRFSVCLENLPHDPKFPDRFGDNLGDVLDVAEEFDLKVCFDLGHYLTGEHSPGFVEFEQVKERLLKRLGHIHLHGLSPEADHQPLQEEDDRLKQLVRQTVLDADYPYSGIISIEIDQPQHLPDSRRVLSGWLKEA